MSINKPSSKSMNRSYTVDTGYSSGAYTHKNTRKSLNSVNNNNHSFDCSSTHINQFNKTMPTKPYSNFAQRFVSNPSRTNSANTTKNKEFYLPNPVHNTSVNNTLNSLLLVNKTNSFLDNSTVSNTSESSHYSALFSR